MANSSTTDAGPVVLLRAYFTEPFGFSIEVLNPIIINVGELGFRGPPLVREEIQRRWSISESDGERLTPELISGPLDQSPERMRVTCTIHSSFLVLSFYTRRYSRDRTRFVCPKS